MTKPEAIGNSASLNFVSIQYCAEQADLPIMGELATAVVVLAVAAAVLAAAAVVVDVGVGVAGVAAHADVAGAAPHAAAGAICLQHHLLVPGERPAAAH